jgi:glycosyltransferase involved in cell wall biosynthesis
MTKSVLVLFTYLVNGSMPLRLCREMRGRGMNVFISHYLDATGTYTPDRADDFRRAGKLVDLTECSPLYFRDLIEMAVDEHEVGLIVQVGCEPLYEFLPILRERRPDIRIVDMLFNDVGHVVSHFLFERGIDGVIVESHYMADYVRRSSEIEERNVHVVESGIDIETFKPNKRKTLRGDELVVGYVGRMSPEKNPRGFIDVAEAILAHNSSLKFKIFGEGSQSSDVKARVQASRWRDNISFVGYVEDIRSAYAQIDVLIVPSTLDGRPANIMEANACAIPVIATPVGGIPELIEDGVNGVLCPLTDTESMTKLLTLWQSEPASFDEARLKARKTAEQRFSRELMIQNYEALFASYLSLSARPPRHNELRAAV